MEENQPNKMTSAMRSSLKLRIARQMAKDPEFEKRMMLKMQEMKRISNSKE